MKASKLERVLSRDCPLVWSHYESFHVYTLSRDCCLSGPTIYESFHVYTHIFYLNYFSYNRNVKNAALRSNLEKWWSSLVELDLTPAGTQPASRVQTAMSCWWT